MATPHRESPLMKVNNSGTKGVTPGVTTTHEGGYGRSNYPLNHLVQGRNRPTGNAQAPAPTGAGEGS